MDKKNIDWANLGFGYVDTDKRFVANFKDGKWDDGVLTEDSNVVINECAGVITVCSDYFRRNEGVHNRGWTHSHIPS